MIGYFIACAVFAILIGITVLLLTGRGANLIAGFNTLSKGEKEKYNKQALCKFVGKILIPIIIVVFISVIAGMANASWNTWFTIVVGIVSLPYVVFIAVYANTGNRFKK